MLTIFRSICKNIHSVAMVFFGYLGGLIMLVINKEQVHDIPVLHIVKQIDYSNSLPLVIFLHGFSSSKEKNLHFAYLLAEKGFRVALPEALFHGERQKFKSDKDLNIRFWDIVLNTIEEMNAVKVYFEEKGLIDGDRIGLAGTSMGGIVTLGALTQYEWIKAAVSLMGMPSYEEYANWQMDQMERFGVTMHLSKEEKEDILSKLRPFDLSQYPSKLQNRPILFWHGKKDPVVPMMPTYEFYEKIKMNYLGNPDRLQFIADNEAGHTVSRAGELKTVEWFEKYL